MASHGTRKLVAQISANISITCGGGGGRGMYEGLQRGIPISDIDRRKASNTNARAFSIIC